MDKPEARVERGPTTHEAAAILMAKLLEREGKTVAADMLRQLHTENEALQTRYEACDKALRQWLDKTAWIQETGRGCELGMHRADAVRQRLSAVEAQRDALLEALKSTGLFLHHCWCDVQMNDHSFEKLNRQMEIVDAAIKAVEGEKT